MIRGRLASKPRLTISNVPIKPCQRHLSLCFLADGEDRRFLSGDLDFTPLDQKRNSIPNEFVKLER